MRKEPTHQQNNFVERFFSTKVSREMHRLFRGGGVGGSIRLFNSVCIRGKNVLRISRDFHAYVRPRQKSSCNKNNWTTVIFIKDSSVQMYFLRLQTRAIYTRVRASCWSLALSLFRRPIRFPCSPGIQSTRMARGPQCVNTYLESRRHINARLR